MCSLCYFINPTLFCDFLHEIQYYFIIIVLIENYFLNVKNLSDKRKKLGGCRHLLWINTEA